MGYRRGERRLPNAARIVARFRVDELSEGELVYLRFAAKRYELLVAHVDGLVADMCLTRPLRLLDIGPGFQTEILRDLYPSAVIDSLGLRTNRPGPRDHEQHWFFDLNDTYDGALPTAMGEYDVIVMAEVLEHLYTAPHIVLAVLSRALRPGGLLVIQTPNGVALHKRLVMLAGRHPFGAIPESRENPLHFRESTMSELQSEGARARLELVDLHAENYFERGSRLSKLYNFVANHLPRGLRAGITITFRRPSEDPGVEARAT